MMPFQFNFAPQQGQQIGSNPLQQILAQRQQQSAMPMQMPQDMPAGAGKVNTSPPVDFMKLAGMLGYTPDAKADPLTQQSAAIGHIMNKLGGLF